MRLSHTTTIKSLHFSVQVYNESIKSRVCNKTHPFCHSIDQLDQTSSLNYLCSYAVACINLVSK